MEENVSKTVEESKSSLKVEYTKKLPKPYYILSYCMYFIIFALAFTVIFDLIDAISNNGLDDFMKTLDASLIKILALYLTKEFYKLLYLIKLNTDKN